MNMTGHVLFYILAGFFGAGILAGALLGYGLCHRRYERDGGRMDKVYEEGAKDTEADPNGMFKAGYAAGVRDVREQRIVNARSPEFDPTDFRDPAPTVLEGTVIPPGETTLERLTPVISSKGYHLVPDEPEPEPVPDYVPDTWLRDELAKTRDWSAREIEKQIRWRNRLPAWKPEKVSA